MSKQSFLWFIGKPNSWLLLSHRETVRNSTARVPSRTSCNVGYSIVKTILGKHLYCLLSLDIIIVCFLVPKVKAIVMTWGRFHAVLNIFMQLPWAVKDSVDRVASDILIGLSFCCTWEIYRPHLWFFCPCTQCILNLGSNAHNFAHLRVKVGTFDPPI